jgi:hypothetical protein
MTATHPSLLLKIDFQSVMHIETNCYRTTLIFITNFPHMSCHFFFHSLLPNNFLSLAIKSVNFVTLNCEEERQTAIKLQLHY